MGERLTRGFNAIMAADTVSCDVHVIEVRWQPAYRGVAIVACVPAGDVGWVFSCCREPIMTGAAGTQDLRMVHGISRRPDIAVMTVLADIGRLYVTQVLTGSVNAIVTTRAVSDDVHVIKIRRPPGNSRMTVVTGITAGEVGRVFAGCNDAVVTGITGANDLRVIDGKHRREDIRVVAILANIARLDMCQVLAGRLHAIVAVDAIPGDVQVVKIRRQPPVSGMAVVTSIPAGQMVEVFSTRDNTIVTRATGSDDLHVIDNVDRRERTGVVAVFANNCGLYMCRVFARRRASVVTARTVIENIRVIEVRWQPGGA